MLAWRAFLLSPTGRKLFQEAAKSLPPLLPGGGVNEILIRSGEHRGWSGAFSALAALTNPPPVSPKTPEEFPPLEDDTKWGPA